MGENLLWTKPMRFSAISMGENPRGRCNNEIFSKDFIKRNMIEDMPISVCFNLF